MITVRDLARPAAVLAAAASISTGLAAGPAVQQASASTLTSLSRFDQRLVADMNHARAARGIRQLVVVAGTSDVAHGWSCHLANVELLAHNGNLGSALDSHGSANATTYGENVGAESTADGADALFHAYMNSPAHRANILDPSFKYVGVWTKRGGGFRWNTIDFVGKTSSSYSYGYGGMKKTC
jgi:uncharacterized protein YkwD